MIGGKEPGRLGSKPQTVNPSCQVWTVGERTGERMVMSRMFQLLAVTVGGLLLTGCVMAEKYEAEKARGLNFQRLLAQEEKRTAELDADLKKARRRLTEAETKNRELMSELISDAAGFSTGRSLQLSRIVFESPFNMTSSMRFSPTTNTPPPC